LKHPILRYLLVAALTAGLALAGVVYATRRMAPDYSVAAAPSPSTSWEYKTEQEWIVAEVVRALVDMAQYARTRTAPDAAALQVKVEQAGDPDGITTFQVTVPARGKTWPLRVTDHIWAPDL
jgi:hypothetical protein